MIWRTISARTIAPIAAISRAVRPYDWPAPIVWMRRMIGPPPSSPITVIVIGAACAPVPTPPTPTPGLVGNHQRTDADADAKSDHRRRRRCASDVHHCRIILRHINNLRIGRLNDIHRLSARRLYLHFLLGIGAQCSRFISLRAQTLNRSRYGSLIGEKGIADGGVVVNVLRHHGQNIRKIHQSDECRIEPLLLRGVREGGAGQSAMLMQPVVRIENLLRICRCRCDLRQQRIWVKRDRRQQLVKLFRRGNSGLRFQHRRETLKNQQNDQERTDRNA